MRRASISRSLVHETKVLFLDEPDGIDPTSRVAVWDEVSRLNDDHGTRCSSRRVTRRSDNSRRLAIIDHGRMCAKGTGATKAAGADPARDESTRALEAARATLGRSAAPTGASRYLASGLDAARRSDRFVRALARPHHGPTRALRRVSTTSRRRHRSPARGEYGVASISGRALPTSVVALIVTPSGPRIDLRCSSARLKARSAAINRGFPAVVLPDFCCPRPSSKQGFQCHERRIRLAHDIETAYTTGDRTPVHGCRSSSAGPGSAAFALVRPWC